MATAEGTGRGLRLLAAALVLAGAVLMFIGYDSTAWFVGENGQRAALSDVELALNELDDDPQRWFSLLTIGYLTEATAVLVLLLVPVLAVVAVLPFARAGRVVAIVVSALAVALTGIGVVVLAVDKPRPFEVRPARPVEIALQAGYTAVAIALLVAALTGRRRGYAVLMAVFATTLAGLHVGTLLDFAGEPNPAELQPAAWLPVAGLAVVAAAMLLTAVAAGRSAAGVAAPPGTVTDPPLPR